MKLLLDTHVAIWAVDAASLLPARVKAMVNDPVNDVYVSAVTIWEIAIKFALRKHAGQVPVSSSESLWKFREAEFELLDVTPAHAVAVETLPPLHGDPFDRLLVAQALSEPMRLVSHDRRVAAYSDTVITW